MSMFTHLPLILVASLSLAFAACGGADDPGDVNQGVGTGTGDGTGDVTPGDGTPDDGTLPDDGHGDDGTETTGGSKDLLVDTKLDATTVFAGTEVMVDCVVTDGTGASVTVDTEVSVTPTVGTETNGHTVLPLVAGAYEVQCAVTGSGEVDGTPASLTVLAAPASKTFAVVDPSEVTAGGTAQVTCTVEDAYGNSVDEAPTTVIVVGTDLEPVDIDDHTVTGQLAGTWQLACAVPGVADDALGTATLTVSPGAAADLEIEVTPDLEAYNPTAVVTVVGVVVDAYGNPAAGADAMISAPAGTSAFGDNGDQWRLDDEGWLTFTASVADTDLSAERTLLVDGAPPVIEITWPERGATLDGGAIIDVTGKVTDAGAGVESLTLGGLTVSVASNGTFKAPFEAAHGLNILEFAAVDALGKTSDTSPAFYHSTGWHDFDTTKPDDARIANALLVFLGQEVLDDGDHSYDDVDDLATVLEIMLSDFDLESLGIDGTLWEQAYPDTFSQALAFGPATGSLSTDITMNAVITSVDVESPTITLDAREGGIIVGGTITGSAGTPAVTVTLTATATVSTEVSASAANPLCPLFCDPPEISTSDTIVQTATFDVVATIDELTFSADLSVHKLTGEELSVTLESLDLDTVGVGIDPISNPTIDLGTLSLAGVVDIPLGSFSLDTLIGGLDDVLADGLLEPVLNSVLTLTEELLLPLFQSQIGPLFEGTFGSLGIDETISIPALIGEGDETDVDFSAELDTLWFTEAGGEMGLSVLADSKKAVSRSPLGSIGRSTCNGTDEGEFSFGKTHPMEIGAHFDMFNQIVHALWWGGGFNLVLGPDDLGDTDLSQYGLGDLELAVQPLLPPIVDDCNSKGLTFVQVGDLMLSGSLTLLGSPVTLTAYVSAEAETVIGALGNEVALTVGALTQFEVEVVEVVSDAGFEPDDFEALLSDVLVPMLLGDYLGQTVASVPLPGLDLGAAVDFLPAGVELTIGDLDVIHSHGVIGLGGELQ